MLGIDLNAPIRFEGGSLRFFHAGERHVSRFCRTDVLLLVYEGVLRFSEDGEEVEVGAGEYYIQRHDARQDGKYESDMPKYLYAHFLGQWRDGGQTLPQRGRFQYPLLRDKLERLDALCHSDAALTQRLAVFYAILSDLYDERESRDVAAQIARYLAKHMHEKITLDRLSRAFNFSKNHVVHLFRQAYGQTPTTWLTQLRVRGAMRLLEVTSDSAERVALQCGFSDYSAFYRAFVKQNGISPAAWRARVRAGR